MQLQDITTDMARYRTHPVQHFPNLPLQTGYAPLAEEIVRLVRETPTPLIVIDGFVGVLWDQFATHLRAALAAQGVTLPLRSTTDLFAPSTVIDELLASYLTDDPVFGRRFHGRLPELWQDEQVKALQEHLAQRTTGVIVYGYGAALLADGDRCWYLDVPKDRGQQLAAQGAIRNVGASEPASFGAMYKRLYFVDWPMLNHLKHHLLPRLDRFIDASQIAVPVSVDGPALRQTLHALAQRPFRVKPWFAPGPWGGQWMKERFGLPAAAPNYAWSFELIAPENGILLGNATQTIECSFDYLLWAETDAVLGPRVAARYGSYFPIRLDYLDTMGGTNLSLQVHPQLDYMRETFGEPITQDETYYIVTNTPGAQVFLGLRDDIDLARFRADATAARDDGRPFAITDHVNSLPSVPHDLFLIPSGTVHCSGADNLVLEISATPYIYTFKIYDYLRSDLTGALRHTHLDHAFANIVPTRTAAWVAKHGHPQPRLLRSGEGWGEYVLGDSDALFFAIHRLEFVEAITDTTEAKFLALNLVAGEHCTIVVPGQAPVELRFAESIIIPATVGDFTLHNTGTSPCKVVKAFVKG